MQQTRKCKQWHFGMKVHVGANSKSARCTVWWALARAYATRTDPLSGLQHDTEKRF
jgi:hypothetical protein